MFFSTSFFAGEKGVLKYRRLCTHTLKKILWFFFCVWYVRLIINYHKGRRHEKKIKITVQHIFYSVSSNECDVYFNFRHFTGQQSFSTTAPNPCIFYLSRKKSCFLVSRDDMAIHVGIL